MRAGPACLLACGCAVLVGPDELYLTYDFFFFLLCTEQISFSGIRWGACSLRMAISYSLASSPLRIQHEMHSDFGTSPEVPKSSLCTMGGQAHPQRAPCSLRLPVPSYLDEILGYRGLACKWN